MTSGGRARSAASGLRSDAGSRSRATPRPGCAATRHSSGVGAARRRKRRSGASRSTSVPSSDAQPNMTSMSCWRTIAPDAVPEQFDRALGPIGLQYAGAAEFEKIALGMAGEHRRRRRIRAPCRSRSPRRRHLLAEQPVGADDLRPVRRCPAWHGRRREDGRNGGRIHPRRGGSPGRAHRRPPTSPRRRPRSAAPAPDRVRPAVRARRTSRSPRRPSVPERSGATGALSCVSGRIGTSAIHHSPPALQDSPVRPPHKDRRARRRRDRPFRI